MSSSSPNAGTSPTAVVLNQHSSRTTTSQGHQAPAVPVAQHHQPACTVAEANAAPVIFRDRGLDSGQRFAVHQIATDRLVVTLHHHQRHADVGYAVKMVCPGLYRSVIEAQREAEAYTKEWRECEAEDRQSALDAQYEEVLLERQMDDGRRFEEEELPAAATCKFSHPVPWRMTAANGATSYHRANLGTAALHHAISWGKARGGLAGLAHLANHDPGDLDVSEVWSEMSATSVSIDPNQER